MQFTEGVPAVRAERPFEPPHAESYQQYFEKLSGYLKTPIGGLNVDAQQWTGQNTFSIGADIPFDKAAINDNGNPSIMPNAVKISRVVGPGAKETQGSALSVIAKSEAGTRQQTWNIFSFVDDYSAPIGETAFTKAFTGAVGVYSKAFKRSIAPIWGGVFEVQDYSENDEGQLYGIEISIQSENLDPNNYRQGMAIFFGSRSGAASRHYAGINITPFGGQTTAELGYGVVVNGKMSNAAFASGSTGPTMVYGAGRYSDAAIKVSDATQTPYAIDMGGGSRMRFRSGNASGTGAFTWYSGFPALTFIGVLEIVVDTTVLYLPVSSTK